MDTLIVSSIVTLAASGILGGIGNALMVVLGLGLVIFFHELGHFAVAKWCGVHVERFSIGIGPILWSRQKGETEYALSALPLGGYVKMLGQDDMDPNQMTSEEIAENPRSYSAKKVWQRMLIISAGVVMNIITGFGFFAFSYNLGVQELQPVFGRVLSGSSAWEAGIQPGDTIRAINESDIQSWSDFQEAIVLSSGDVTIRGIRDGEEFSQTLRPRQGKRTRQMGVMSSSSLKISPQATDPGDIAVPGLPAAQASEPFLPGDRIVAANGTTVDSWHQYAEILARQASKEVELSVERDATGASEAAGIARAKITIPPARVRSLGFWMRIGPVESLQEDSVAARQGLEKGDLILSVDDLKIGEDIDPMRLPNYFAARSGTAVKVIVSRSTTGPIGDQKKELEITPEDDLGWIESPLFPDAPLPIPSIGAAIRIGTHIAKIVDGSEVAAISDPEKQIKAGQRITKVSLPYSKDDYFGTATDNAKIIDLEEDEDINWAAVFLSIQHAPLRNIRVHIGESGDNEAFSVELEAKEFEDDWYLPFRGLQGWEPLSRKRVAESPNEAIQLGLRKTRKSIISIYQTLLSLFRQELSAKALSGPLGIISIGYAVADSGLAQLLGFLGLLSINLAVLNFLPIPILDGGHMVFLIWEGVTRKKPSPTVIGWAHAVGLFFIISLFLFVMYLDVVVRFLGFGAD